MANANAGAKSGSNWRVLGWGTAVLILLLPLAAMQFTNEVNWDETDFIFAGVLIGGVGAMFELAVRKTRSWAYRGGVALALAVTFLTVWVNAAVGMIGNEDNVLNLMFLGVLALALVGAILVRFRAEGMARVMTVAAAAQVLAGAIGAFTDLRGGIYSALFAGFWLVSARLFSKAARDAASSR